MSTLQQQLFRACQSDDEPVVRKLIEFGLDPNTRSPTNTGSTMLHTAAQLGKTSIVYTLVELGANVSACNKWGDTPLHLATLTNKVNTMRALIQLGVDPNIPGENGSTALHVAAWNGHPLATHMLLSLGANPNISNNNGELPSGHASIREHHEVLQMLTNAEKIRRDYLLQIRPQMTLRWLICSYVNRSLVSNTLPQQAMPGLTFFRFPAMSTHNKPEQPRAENSNLNNSSRCLLL